MIDKKKCAVSLAEQILKDAGIKYILFADEVGIKADCDETNIELQNWLLSYIALACVENNVSTAELVSEILGKMDGVRALKAEGELKW